MWRTRARSTRSSSSPAPIWTRAQANALGKASGLAVGGVDELIADRSIDVILNLTPPLAHAAITSRALAAGKHVYTEKPLATDEVEAGRAGRRGRAPRAAHRLRARHLPRLGLPGRSLGDRRGRDRRPALRQRRDARRRAGDLAPEPRHLLRRRRGPAVRHGPLLPDGDRRPARPDRARRRLRLDAHAGADDRDRAAASASASSPRRRRTRPPRCSSRTASRRISSPASRRAGQYICDVAIHGSEGVLLLPDPNAFGGAVRLKRGRGGWEDVPYASRGGADARGIGLHDMVEAIAAGTAAPRLGPARRARRRGRAGDPARGGGGQRRRDLLARRPAAAAARHQPGVVAARTPSRRRASGCCAGCARGRRVRAPRARAGRRRRSARAARA